MSNIDALTELANQVDTIKEEKTKREALLENAKKEQKKIIEEIKAEGLTVEELNTKVEELSERADKMKRILKKKIDKCHEHIEGMS